MQWEYVCRYCHTVIGQIDATQVTEQQLGFDRLTPEEREDIIINSTDGRQQVRVICETCQQMVADNPERLLEPYLYH